MEDPIKEKLVAAVGQTNADALEAAFLELAEARYYQFNNTILAEFDKAKKLAFEKLGGMGLRKELEMEMHLLLQNVVVDQVVCSLLMLTSLTQAERPISHADFAHHALEHYGSALQERSGQALAEKVLDIIETNQRTKIRGGKPVH